MAGAGDSSAFPAAFRSLEEDFVDSKMAINNSVTDILRNDGALWERDYRNVELVETERLTAAVGCSCGAQPPPPPLRRWRKRASWRRSAAYVSLSSVLL